jgi:hypothetical protein
MGSQREGQKVATSGKQVREIIREWPKNPKDAAIRLLDYYGEPDEYSLSQLIWYNTRDGWKRTVLYKEEIPHNFPAQHTDYLEQFIDYKAPIEMYSKLAEYDGSIIVDRTKGELSARCGGTSMNFVAINLAHDIVTGDKTVQQAREEYTYLYKTFKDGKRLPYTQNFQFDLPKGNTGDPDSSTL